MAHFVLDQNFPLQVTGLPWAPSLRVSRLAELDVRLTAAFEDWEIFRALHNRGDVDGFITNDAKLLQLPREMVMLAATRLTLVVTDRVGHDPVRATGLVMVSLTQIAGQLSGAPQIYVLRPPELGKHRTSPNDRLTRIAEHRNVARQDLVDAERAVLGLRRR